MRFFVKNSEREGTCYHEFYSGEWDGKSFWKEDSLYLHDDVLDKNVSFENVLRKVISFDPLGETKVSKENWEEIGRIIPQDDISSLELYREADLWAKEVFKLYDYFTIIGV